MFKILFTIFSLLNIVSYGQTECIDLITIKPDGTSKRFNYKDRTYHSEKIVTGLLFTFWDSGFTKIRTQVIIANQKMNGTFKFFNEKGFLKELGYFKDNQEEGFYYYWSDEGILLKREKYIHGVLKGTLKYHK